MSGALYFGDNLDVMREHIRDESVDLIYLDPPFNSSATYNILFRAADGKNSSSQIKAFEDTWAWNEGSERAYDDVLRCGRSEVADVLRALRQFLKENDMMAYIAMMAVRLTELHKKLKPTGNLFLHCDSTASHYLKIVMDAIFGIENFENEIIWKRTTSHNDAKNRFPAVTDTILFYSKSLKNSFYRQFTTYSEEYLSNKYRHVDASGRRYRLSDLRSPSPRPNLTYDYKGYKPHPNGWAVSYEKMQTLDAAGMLDFPRKPDGRIQIKRYLDERSGMPIGSLWDDIRPVNAMAQERLGYPTQKPVALLERIIQCATKEGDVVLDPFCGCGTAVHAAEKLGRRWIGIDITPLAVNLIARRLKDAFPGISYDVRGIPGDMDGAHELAARDKHLFQLWATDLIGAQPYRDGKKGADGGIDGMIYFKPDGRATKAAIVSVKGGANVNVSHVRDLRGTIERLQEPMGVIVTLYPPTEPMRREAASAGLYDTGFGKPTPRIQIVTVEEALRLGERVVQIPFGHASSFKQAPRERQSTKPSVDLFGEIGNKQTTQKRKSNRKVAKNVVAQIALDDLMDKTGETTTF